MSVLSCYLCILTLPIILIPSTFHGKLATQEKHANETFIKGKYQTSLQVDEIKPHRCIDPREIVGQTVCDIGLCLCTIRGACMLIEPDRI